MTSVDLSTLGLPQIFAPRQAAEILRGLGLTEMTECALRTRAYRKQVPFHLNGRRHTAGAAPVSLTPPRAASGH